MGWKYKHKVMPTTNHRLDGFMPKHPGSDPHCPNILGPEQTDTV